jgi:ubiquinone/menaquinone biosynthesis C-methylase UbiE
MNEGFLEFSEEHVARCSDENAKSWAGQVRKGLDIYRECFNNPAFFEFVGTLKGKKVLDAGCGEGYNTRIMARMGARVTGVEISPRLIRMARAEERRERLGIRYCVASFTDLSMFEDASFDIVISTMALDASPNFEEAISEFFRVLSSGGKLFFNVLHPCFVTKGLSWTKDDAGEDGKLIVSHYFDESPRLEEWKFVYAPPSTKPFVTPAFYWTLSRILKALVRTGFVLKDVEEPRPSEEACKKFPRMKKWREHAALFFYIHCEKPKVQEK